MASHRKQTIFVIAAAAAAIAIIGVGGYLAYFGERIDSALGDRPRNAYAKGTDPAPTSGAGGPKAVSQTSNALATASR